MVLINDRKLSLIAKLIIAYILLLDFAFLIFALTAGPSTDVASVTASLLGWTATLFTPIAAFFFYDTWKEQKNFDTDLEILKECDENLFRFKNELDFICNKIIKIYNEYASNKNYYIAHSIYKKKLEIESIYLENFFINISRYTDFHKDEDFISLVREFYSISNEILYINKDFSLEIYKPIYDEIKKYSSLDLVDSTLLISFSPHQDGIKRHLTQRYRLLRTNYINTGYLTELNKETNEEEDKTLNYEEYYKLMEHYYSKINNYIKIKIRA